MSKLWAVVKQYYDSVENVRVFTSPEVAIPYASAIGASWRSVVIEESHGAELREVFAFRWSYRNGRDRDGNTAGWRRWELVKPTKPLPPDGILGSTHNLYDDRTSHGSMVTVDSSVSMEHAIATAEQILLRETGTAYKFEGFKGRQFSDDIKWAENQIREQQEAEGKE
jgi:hypothetical protein